MRILAYIIISTTFFLFVVLCVACDVYHSRKGTQYVLLVPRLHVRGYLAPEVHMLCTCKLHIIMCMHHPGTFPLTALLP